MAIPTVAILFHRMHSFVAHVGFRFPPFKGLSYYVCSYYVCRFTSEDLDECEAAKKGDMWTAEEDARILQAVAIHGLKWRLIAADMPGRSANSVQ